MCASPRSRAMQIRNRNANFRKKKALDVKSAEAEPLHICERRLYNDANSVQMADLVALQFLSPLCDQ